MEISLPVDIAVEPQSVVGVTFDGKGQALVTTFDKIVKFESDATAGLLVGVRLAFRYLDSILIAV